MVYKTVGFSYDNILAGFSAMGYTYIEMFMNLTKRMFNWFVELFDHKIVPNVQSNNNGNGSLGTIKKVFNPSTYGETAPINQYGIHYQIIFYLISH